MEKQLQNAALLFMESLHCVIIILETLHWQSLTGLWPYYANWLFNTKVIIIIHQNLLSISFRYVSLLNFKISLSKYWEYNILHSDPLTNI